MVTLRHLFDKAWSLEKRGKMGSAQMTWLTLMDKAQKMGAFELCEQARICANRCARSIRSKKRQ